MLQEAVENGFTHRTVKINETHVTTIKNNGPGYKIDELARLYSLVPAMPENNQQERDRKTRSITWLNKIIEKINQATGCDIRELDSSLRQQGGKRKNNSKNNTKKRKLSRKNNRKRRASKNKRN